MADDQQTIIPVPIEDEMKEAYLTYAMSVIVSRALPDVRDGLKPVHRRILYAMNDMGITPDKGYKKSARIVGEVLGKYHPHGDLAVYNTMVRMAQEFSMRNLIIDGQGNYGSVDGDSPAAMRYTEARMTRYAMELLRDINKKTVNTQLNFDDSLEEPVVLPASVPNLLVNGSTGIAVGMATNIPPHDLREVVDGHGNPAFVGRDMAAPLMFEIIDSIKAKKRLRGPMHQRAADGRNLTKREFCAVSGRLPTALCPNTVMGWYIPGKSPIHKYQIHREVLIDRNTGYRSCGGYSRNIRSEVFEFWPSDLLKLFKKAGIPRRTPPPYDPRCSMGAYDTKGQAPQIVSPLTHVTYHIRQGIKKTQKIPLMATTKGDVQKVYWFMNESYLGQSRTSAAFFWSPRPGRYVIRAVDGFGRSDTRKILVTRVR